MIRRTGLDIKLTDPMIGGRVALGKGIPLALDCFHLYNRRTSESFRTAQHLFQFLDVVPVDRAEILQAHLFKKGIME